MILAFLIIIVVSQWSVTSWLLLLLLLEKSLLFLGLKSLEDVLEREVKRHDLQLSNCVLLACVR